MKSDVCCDICDVQEGFIFTFFMQLMTMLLGTSSSRVLKRDVVQQLLKPGAYTLVRILIIGTKLIDVFEV